VERRLVHNCHNLLSVHIHGFLGQAS
jgi:hypothetical protein